MRDKFKITSTSATGTAHALEFRGQLKTLALSLTAIILTGLAAGTLLGTKALDRCPAPCFVELRRDFITLAPSGATLAQEILITGTIPSPARPLLIAANPALARDHRITPLDASSTHSKKSDRLMAMPHGLTNTKTAPRAVATSSAGQGHDRRPRKTELHKRTIAVTTTTPAMSGLHIRIWNAADRT